MELVKKAILPLVLSLGMFSSAVSADTFSGYASEVFSSVSAGSSFVSGMIGMSSTDGGVIERYVFTSDSSYLNMLVSARANHEAVTITQQMGGLTSVNYYR